MLMFGEAKPVEHFKVAVKPSFFSGYGLITVMLNSKWECPRSFLHSLPQGTENHNETH
jgi:hypothetical protein